MGDGGSFVAFPRIVVARAKAAFFAKQMREKLRGKHILSFWGQRVENTQKIPQLVIGGAYGKLP